LVGGTATVYAGRPDADSHRSLAQLVAGQTFQISGVAADEVVSVQNDSPFTYNTTTGATSAPTAPPASAPGDVITSTHALWRCNTLSCSGDDWVGEVIPWPPWAAYQSNARTGSSSRSVYSATGEPLYPYMGAWAEGCEVTVHSGVALIIEWQRGTDVWRETRVDPGETQVIHLQSPENGAMIETYDNMPAFSVSLAHCEPQLLP
jgi:hypothetical protein